MPSLAALTAIQAVAERRSLAIHCDLARWATAVVGSRSIDQRLLAAAAIGDANGVRAALADGADVDAVGAAGRGTALLLAAAWGWSDVVDALLAAGANAGVGVDGSLIPVLDDVIGVVALIPVFQPEAAVGLAAHSRYLAIVERLDQHTGRDGRRDA